MGRSLTLHLKMVKMVNFTLHEFYYNFKKFPKGVILNCSKCYVGKAQGLWPGSRGRGSRSCLVTGQGRCYLKRWHLNWDLEGEEEVRYQRGREGTASRGNSRKKARCLRVGQIEKDEILQLEVRWKRQRRPGFLCLQSLMGNHQKGILVMTRFLLSRVDSGFI